MLKKSQMYEEKKKKKNPPPPTLLEYKLFRMLNMINSELITISWPCATIIEV